MGNQYGGETIEQLQERQRVDEEIEAENLRLIEKLQQEEKTDIQKEKKVYECQFCQCQFQTIEHIATLNCEHQLCHSCLTMQIETYIQENKIKVEEMVCPQCQVPLEKNAFTESWNHQIVIAHTTQEQWDKISQLRMKQMQGIIECPTPSCTYWFEINENMKSVKCVQCQNNFCIRCFDQSHDGNCDQNAILKGREEVRKAGMDVRKCPFCDFYAAKDSGCQHVTCTNCSEDWCFCCEVRRSPTLGHGNHYHKEGCWCYFEFDGQDDYKPDKCTECQKIGQICPRPGRINEELIAINHKAKEERDKRDAENEAKKE